MSAMGERQFGPYRLVQQIAVGGMAEIHLAKTHGIAGFEKYVALKMIHPNFSQDHQFIQMLIDEAKITVQLQHVNIAQTFDLGRVGDTFYITMEYVDGADLYKLLRKSSELDRLFPIALGAFIGKEVAGGLDYAHRKRDHGGIPLGIVHRDVSPQNVLISYAGEVKLVDFGIAKATMRARQTAAGVIKGKYYYMSPEQAWGEPLDHRTDVFSAGILLYETLTGQMLYLEEDLHKLLEMVRRADIPPPSSLRAEIPPALDGIVMHALAKRPEDRYQTAGDFANDLERFLHSYAPVFTANKVANWMHDVLGQPVSPTLLGLTEKPEPERDRGETRRLTRDQLVLARSEFTDENSIIFGFARESSGGDREGALDESSTFDAPMPGGEAEDVDSLPAAPRDREPSVRPRLVPSPPAAAASLAPAAARVPAPARAPMRLPEEPRPLPDRGAGSISADSHDYIEPPTLRRLPGVSPGPPRGGAPVGPRQPTAPAGPRSRDQETRLLKEPVAPPPRRSGPLAAPLASVPLAPAPSARIVPAPSSAPIVPRPPALAAPAMGDEPTEAVDDDGASSNPDDETIISEGPNWWSGPGDHTEVAEAPFGEDGFVAPPGELDHEAPTLLKLPPMPGPPAGTWQPAPALHASVSQPAVSQIRPPRNSRRTPASGVATGQGADLQAHPADGPTDSVLAALLAPAERRGAEVVLSPPTSLADGAPAPAVSFAVGRSAAGSQPPPVFSTRAMAAALERDEIPEHYKIRRGRQPTTWLIGLFAVVLAVAVAGALIAIYGTGSDDEAAGDAVLQLISIPAGAAVTVDGQLLAQRTPTTIRGARGKRYLFGFELPRYQHDDQEFIVPEQGAEHQVVARLDPMIVKLTIESVPPGAEVFLGGNSVGRTPLVLPGLDPQTTKFVELRLKGYRPVRQLLDWSTKTDQRLVVPLQQ